MTAACGARGPGLKPGCNLYRGSPDMLAIGIILLFVIAFAALNFFEFGSID